MIFIIKHEVLNIKDLYTQHSIVALFIAKGTAIACLEVAKQSIILARNAVNTFPLTLIHALLVCLLPKKPPMQV